MNISIILSTYKRPQILFKTLESFTVLKTEGLTWEAIIVDNAGDLESKQTVEGFVGRLPLKFIVEKNQGKNNALNRAVKEARGDLFVFTDDDVIATPDWLVEMWEGSRRWPKFSVFGGSILPSYPPGNLPVSEVHQFIKDAYVIADWDIEEGPYDANNVWGPNMAVRSQIFHSGWSFNANVGPNGKNYIMGSETEFTTRLEKAGFGSVYLSKSLVYHQIRQEQLKARWLYGRAFRVGRFMANKIGLPDVPVLFGVPLYLIRNLIKLAVQRLLWFFDRKKALHLGISYWSIRGRIYQHRREFSKKGR